MYEALEDLRREVYHRDPKLFALMAEGTVAQIKDLQHQIEVASGLEQVWEAETDL
jgi:hypothetical protein